MKATKTKQENVNFVNLLKLYIIDVLLYFIDLK